MIHSIGLVALRFETILVANSDLADAIPATRWSDDSGSSRGRTFARTRGPSHA